MAGQSNNFDGTSVSGGFNVQGNQFNGPVNIGGSSHDDTDDLQCLRLLNTVNPEDERRRILTVKDQLVAASYSWILENETFRSWLDEETNNLLWIKGGPGKGKTMMMAGLVEALPKTRNSEGAIALSYFFCQNSDTELRTVTSIVKGLIYMLASREKSLVHHLKKKYEAGGAEVFTGPRTLFTLWQVLEDMLRDFHGTRVYLMVDGLDECDDPEFHGFLRLLSDCNVAKPGKIKWLVTSRPLPRIGDIIGPDQDRSRISLEIEAQHVSQGIETFIDEKVKDLQKKRHWSEEITRKVHSYLQSNAEGTFLWVALVCKRLLRRRSWKEKVEDELTKLASLQGGLDSFYERMMQVVRDENQDDADLCMKILRTATLVYRPLRVQELGTIVDELQSDDSPNFESLKDLIEQCGSFILVHDDTIYFVHQSAKDYLSARSISTDFPLYPLSEHTWIAERCLDTLNSCLKDRQFPDPASLSRQELSDGDSRLLSRIAYACTYWIHHTLESVAQASFKDSIPNQGKICDLLEYRLIAWAHALGSLKELTPCVRMIKKFLDIQGSESKNLFHMMQDTYRFLRQSGHIIEESPNQAYISALFFLPISSWTREVYQNHVPKWIRLRTQLNYTWDACLVTLGRHSRMVTSLIFSPDGSLLASISEDDTRLWETETGKCRGIFDSNFNYLAFSPDNRVLVKVTGHSLELLDTATCSEQNSLIGHESYILLCLFAPNSQILASSDDVSVRLWNISTGLSCGVFEFAASRIMGFSHDSKHIVIVFQDGSQSEIQVRDVKTLDIIATFREQYFNVISVKCSPDSSLVLSASREAIWLWTYAPAKSGKKLEGDFGRVNSAKFSPDGRFIVSTHHTERSVILWETSTGNKLHVFSTPLYDMLEVDEPTLSPDSRMMLIRTFKGAKSWDTATGEEIATIKGSEECMSSLICSPDGKLVAQDTGPRIDIWEVATGALLNSLPITVCSREFSPAGGLIATGSFFGAVKLWSLNEGLSNQVTTRNDYQITESVAISLDGTLAASWPSVEEGIGLWDLASGSCRSLHSKPYFYARELVISPDNSLLAGCNTTDVFIWEIENGSLCYEYTGSANDYIHRLAFSPDSRLLKIESTENGGIKLLENYARKFQDLREPSHAEFTQSQKSPDGRFFVGLDPSLRSACLWEQQKDTEQAPFKLELGEAGGIATFSPDSQFVAFVSREGFMSVWETETGACHEVSWNFIRCNSVIAFSHDNRFIAYASGHEHILGLLELSTGIPWALTFVCADPIELVTFSPDASKVAAISGSAVVLWETSGSLARKLQCDQKRVSDIIFLPDQNILIAGHEDGMIRSWDTNNYVLLHTFCTKDRHPQFSLDSKRGFLWTGKGGCFLHEVLQPCEEPAISLDDGWVLFNRERVFWVPIEFRSDQNKAWAASSKDLVTRHNSGNLTHVQFDI